MKATALVLTLGGLAAFQLPTSLRAAEPERPHVATLSCGGGRFVLRSRVGTDPQGPTAPVAQTMSVRERGGSRTVRLEQQGAVALDGLTVRRAYVLSWACVRSDKGASFVSLGYACAVDAGEPGACRAGKEWFRLLDARGRAVDTLAPREGSEHTRLLERLGLAGPMAAGVQMRDVLSDPP